MCLSSRRRGVSEMAFASKDKTLRLHWLDKDRGQGTRDEGQRSGFR